MVAVWWLRLGALESHGQHFTRVDSSGLQEKVTGLNHALWQYGGNILKSSGPQLRRGCGAQKSLPNPEKVA